ncbi:reverse transcriptase domain-containing protein [Tanacetum coccineum]
MTNDVNVLRQSPIFNVLKSRRALDVPFMSNNVPYKRGYYLTDGIYPQWAVLIKSIKNPSTNDHKRILYKTNHEAARKDVERAFGKESVESESFKSSAQHSVNDFVVINIPEEDVEPKQIIPDPDDQPMWESAKTVAPTPNSAIVQIDVDDNFVINSTHLKMICKNKFDGYVRADPHDHIREFLAICDMFKYGETQSEAIKLLIFPYSLSDKAKTWFNELNEESTTSWDQMRKAFINRFFPPSLFNRLLNLLSFGKQLIESHKSSTAHPIVNDFVVINIPEEDIAPKQIILDPDDQPMWESAKIRADPHDHIREFLAICNMLRYGETQSEADKLLIFPFLVANKAKTMVNELNEESIIL